MVPGNGRAGPAKAEEPNATDSGGAGRFRFDPLLCPVQHQLSLCGIGQSGEIRTDFDYLAVNVALKLALLHLDRGQPLSDFEGVAGPRRHAQRRRGLLDDGFFDE